MNLFLQLNLLIGISGVLFVLAEKFLQYMSVRISFTKALRFAQLIFILSLTLPLILKLLPSTSIRGVPSKTFTAYSEGMSQTLSVDKVITQKPIITTSSSNSKDVGFEFDYTLIALLIWLVGFCYFFFRFAVNYFQVRRLLSSSVPIKTYKRVKIVASEEVYVPFSVRMPKGIWVVVPVLLLSEKKDLDLAIQHEIQHHRQGDTAWAVFMELVGSFLYFNPAVYLWKNIITELQELSCDESLIGREEISSHDYGSCLLRVAEAALEHRHMYAGTISMAAIIKDSNYFKKFLLRRIEMITEKSSHTKPWITISASLFIILASVAAAIGSEKLIRGKRNINPGIVKVEKEIQKITDEALTRALSRMKATAGFIIVTEPSTGRILAVANMDLKSKRKGHWILHELMESGPIAKPIMVAEALELGKTDLTSQHNCENGKYAYKGTTYRDWKDGGWNSLTTSETLELSSNICSIKIAQLLGEDRLSSMLEKFGFGEGGTASSFPEALPGERPISGSQLLPQAAIGLGFKSSVIETLQAYGAIANGGTLMEPVSPTEKPKVLRHVLSKKSILQLHQLLQNVVLHGTGKRAQSDLYTTAGKTSTVLNKEFAGVSGYRSKEMANIAGFIGFAPAQNPIIVVYVGIINPNTDGTGAHGGYHAAPVFREVVENVLTHMKVAPDKI